MLKIQIIVIYFSSPTIASILMFFFKDKDSLYLKSHLVNKLVKELRNLIFLC